VERQIHWAGQLSSAEMSWCYYHSRLFVMTSRVEACPNVALEAMSHGAFCIATDNPPLPEFFGEAALYYPPGRSDTLADMILAALSETPEVQSKRRATLRQHATHYSWQNTVEQTIQEIAFAAREAQQHKF
jgi:glycosyltransferase involved in cell wall biosynthesis